MFAPDQERTAEELLRVCRPGGTIGLANWTPDGYIGGMFKTIGRNVPPPAGLESPILWGTEARVRELFGDGVTSLTVTKRRFTFRYRSRASTAWTSSAPVRPDLKAFDALGEAGAKAALEADIVALATTYDRLGDADAVAVPANYLEAVAVRS